MDLCEAMQPKLFNYMQMKTKSLNPSIQVDSPEPRVARLRRATLILFIIALAVPPLLTLSLNLFNNGINFFEIRLLFLTGNAVLSEILLLSSCFFLYKLANGNNAKKGCLMWVISQCLSLISVLFQFLAVYSRVSGLPESWSNTFYSIWFLLLFIAVIVWHYGLHFLSNNRSLYDKLGQWFPVMGLFAFLVAATSGSFSCLLLLVYIVPLRKLIYSDEFYGNSDSENDLPFRFFNRYMVGSIVFVVSWFLIRILTTYILDSML